MNQKKEGPAGPLERLQHFFQGFSGGDSKPPDPKKKQMRFSILYLFLALFLVSLLHDWYLAAQVETIPYSQFKVLVQEDKVGDLVLETNRIRGTLKEPKPPDRQFVTVRVDDPELVKLLDEKGISYKGSVENKWLPALLSWLLPIGLLLLFWSFMMRRMQSGPQGMLSIGKAKAKIYAEKNVGVTFEDVAGIDEAKAELEEIVEFLEDPGEVHSGSGARSPKACCWWARPGTGKTLLARAVAGEAGVPFFSMSGSDFVEMFVGVGAARVRDLFPQAKQNAPCIIFVDELDALGKARGARACGRQRRARADPEPAPGGDGRLRPERGRHHHGGHQPPRDPRPGAAPPRTLRPPGGVDRPDMRGREAILKIHAQSVPARPRRRPGGGRRH